MNENSDKIKVLMNEIEKGERKLMEENALIAKKFFVNTFEKKGFEDVSFQEWEEDKEENKIGELMERTGELKNSIKIDNLENNSVEVVSTAPYAGFVNDGTRRMPARPFMKDSKVLETKILNNVVGFLDKTFK